MKCLNHEISEREEERDHHCYPYALLFRHWLLTVIGYMKFECVQVVKLVCSGYNFSVTLAKCMVEMHVKHNQLFSLD